MWNDVWVNNSRIKRVIILVYRENMFYISWFGMNFGYKLLMIEG